MVESEKKQMARKEFEEQIIKKVQSDKEFKKALVDNPKAALGQLGVQIPEDVEVKVVEESAKVVYLVLPVNPDELTDEQLDGVAGGIDCYGYVCHTWCPTAGCPSFKPTSCPTFCGMSFCWCNLPGGGPFM